MNNLLIELKRSKLKDEFNKLRERMNLNFIGGTNGRTYNKIK